VSYFVRYRGSAANPSAFVAHYRDRHAAILRGLPHIQSLVLHTPVAFRDPFPVREGGTALLAQMMFENEAALDAALRVMPDALASANWRFAGLVIGVPQLVGLVCSVGSPLTAFATHSRAREAGPRDAARPARSAGGAVAISFSRNCCWPIPVRATMELGRRAMMMTSASLRRWWRRRAERSEVGGHRQRIENSAALTADAGDTINAAFFDFEDEYVVKADLRQTASIALSLMDLFYGVNQGRNVIAFSPAFAATIGRLAQETDALLAEMKATDRFKRGLAKFGLPDS
jgi:hypothetical protein